MAEEKIKVEKSKKSNKKIKQEPNEELIKAYEALAEEKEKSLRIQAEMMNFKKRQEDMVNNIRKYANEDILFKLISVVDNFERALSLENDDNKEFLTGFNMIYNNLLNIIKEAGVEEIECLEKPFDPNYHQAVMTEEKEGYESGIVIEVLQKGYMYKDKVLRASMVKVSK